MWIESYGKGKGNSKYYRAVEGTHKIHLGTAESIVLQLKPEALERIKKRPRNPPNFLEGEEGEPPET